jgi:curli biogenesis system outer membrane secretion channel CsgG
MKKFWKYTAQGMTGFILFICVMLVGACSNPAIRPESEQQTSNIKSILILPFHNVSSLYEQNIQVRCYLCGQIMTTGYVPDSGGPFLTSELIWLMEKQQGYTVLSSEGSQDMLSGLSGTGNDAEQYLNLYINAGKRAGADAVLIGHIFRFVDRKGNRASVESPASVAFDLHLIDVDSGKIVWTANFDQTQRPLSDNLLELGSFIKRKASWVSAEELAQGGLEDILRRFPKP